VPVIVSCLGRYLIATNSITDDKRPLPPPAATEEEDDQLFEHDPWVLPPLRADYGLNIKLESGVFINWNSTWVDTVPIRIGARTIVGPNCCFYSGTHPLDPEVRNGLSGPESGKEINIGEDCWFGGNVTVLPGVTIGKGSTIGAGSVVTKVYHPSDASKGSNRGRTFLRSTSRPEIQREY
jgi:acetyltransferase-like isoleucine patch superfamily enzyme